MGLLGVGIALLGPACGPPPKTGLRVKARPTGKISGERALIVVTFDRTMVGPGAVGSPTSRPPAQARLKISPAIEGRYEWLDQRTLTFHPKAPLAPSTRFVVEVPEGTVALDGHGLPEGQRFSFETERLTAKIKLEGQAERTSRWALPDQKVFVTFNHAVRLAEVTKRCRFSTASEQIAVEDPQATSGVTRKRFVLRPRKPLAKNTQWVFGCETGLMPAEGALGLESAVERAFNVYGPLRVLKVTPTGEDVEPEERQTIKISLSNPAASGGDYSALSLEPAVDGFPNNCYRAYYDKAAIRCSVSLKPRTRYTLKVDAALTDVFAQPVERPFSATFATGDAKPGMSIETGIWLVEAKRGVYPLWTRNLTKLEVEAAQITEEQLPRLLDKLNWWDDDAVDLGELKIASIKRRLPIKATKNRWRAKMLDPLKLTNSKRKKGLYYFAVSAPEAEEEEVKEALVNFTDLGVVAKLSAAAGMLWVTRLSTNQPVAGADVVIRDREGRLRWRGKTGKDGVAITPGKQALLAKPNKRPARASASASSEDDEDNDSSAGLLAFVRQGDDLTYVDPLKPGGLAAYNFNVSGDSSAHAERLRGFLHTDRGLYRPGHTVHVKGLARVLRLGRGLRVPDQRQVKVQLKDPRDDTILERELELSAFGGFSFDIALPGDARLGDYTVTAELEQGRFSRTFAVEEYRPATYEVKGKLDRAYYVVGDRLRARAEGRYFYGAPVRGGKVTWRVHSRGRTPRFAAHRGFTFVDERRFSPWSSRASDGQSYVTEGEGRLDKQGLARFAVKVSQGDVSGPVDYIVQAEVKDESNQVIAKSLAVPVHPSSLYLGVKSADWLIEVGKPKRLRLVAVDPAGARKAARGRLRVERKDWSCAWEAWGYRGSYRCQDKKVKVLEREVSIGKDGTVEVAFTPKRSGEHWVILEGKDNKRRKAIAATELWAWGGGVAAYKASDSLTFDVIADKKSYQPGETAKLLLKTHLGSALGLLTIEREGVLERRLFRLDPKNKRIEVPIRASHGPNVYASITLVQGRTGKGKRGLPLLRMGLINLPVAVSSRKLQVTVQTAQQSYKPREEVEATVKVTDAAGRPVRAEVSLAAADEGVLSLIAFKTPDPLPVFYAPWGLGVTSATQYHRLMQLPEPDEERLATGGDGGSRPGTVRSRFMATAIWKPQLLTNARGVARVRFQAPDNLTAFRLMAVAADASERFGSADQRFTVAKPLQLHGALPRFLTVGDTARGGVVVHNHTGKAGSAEVRAFVEGATLEGPTVQRLQLDEGGRALARFVIKARDPGAVKVRFAASLGGERDAVELTLPIKHPSSKEAKKIKKGSVRAGATARLAPTLPRGAIASSAMVDLSIDPDGLAGIDSGLRDLIRYPYGCLEQTTSKVIPMLMVSELAKTLSLEGLQGPALERFLRVGIAKIGRHQTSSGGYSLWPGGRAEPYYTAYALWGLHLARRAGHEVSDRRIVDGVAYLKRALEKEPRDGDVYNEAGELGVKAFSVYVLSQLSNKPDAQLAVKLREQQGKLPRFGLAFLARALGASLGRRDAAVKQLVAQLGAVITREKKGGRAFVSEPDGESLSWYMSDDVRSTAIVLGALVELDPRNKLVRPLVRWLLKNRRASGGWSTTQANLYALLALTRYAQSRASRQVKVRVALGGETLLESALAGKQRIRRIELPLERIRKAGVPLTIGAEGGRVYYDARLRFRRGVAHQKARRAGIALSQRLLQARTGKPIKGNRLKVGDVVRVRLYTRTKEDRDHVVIAARLPAGLEPLNRRFKTVSTGGAAAEDDEDEDDWRIATYRELRDDRVSFYAERVFEGSQIREFLARATTAGSFVVPSAVAEEMYNPETHARTALSTLEISDK